MKVRDSAKYYFTRVLQKSGLSDLTLAVGNQSLCIIPNPPLITKAFAAEASEKEFLSDPSLQIVRQLTRTAGSFWDVGAHMGFFSILARDQNPDLQVVSIEASTDHYQVLCRNWMLNPERWICLHTAAGDKEGLALMSRGLGGFDHVLSKDEAAGGAQIEARPIMTLDHLAALIGHKVIDVLKIDVEGMELAVLRGAAGLLSSGSIGTIILEAEGHETRYGVTNQDLVAFLKSKHYHLRQDRGYAGDGSAGYQVFCRELR